MSARLVEQALTDARRHRAEDDITAAQQALERAWSLAAALEAQHPLRQVAAWRRAKLAFDLRQPACALEALEPVLQDPDPFEHYERGLDACEALARCYWDHVGYGSPTLRRLWERFAEAWAARGDPYLAASGRVQLGWDLACAGDLAGLEALFEGISTLDPARFRRGPTRHPRASDAPSSIPWLQLDLARTALRAATWADAPRLATLAIEGMEDAAEEVGLDRSSDFWFLEPMALAALRIDHADARAYVGPWRVALGRLRHERAELHVALGAAEVSRLEGRVAQSAAAFLGVAEVAARARWGFEWEIDALLEAGRTAGPDADPAWRRRALQRAREHGVGVFAPRLRDPR